MEKVFENILSKFPGKNILVIGDIMLDKYIYGDVTRISPEAPVPVVKLEKEFYDIGGAGNVASNIASLGGNACIFSFVGKDNKADILKVLLKRKKIEFYFDNNFMTTFKIRVIGKGQQLIRIDKEETKEKIFSDEMKKIILEKAQDADLIVISDYSKGAVTEDLMNLLKNYKKKILIDPKPKNKASFSLYKDALLITPNEKEALEMSNSSNIEEAGEKLKKELNSNLLVTRGEKGMMLFSDKTIEIPTYALEVYDVSGAGDSVIAALSLALSSGCSLEESAIIANHAAGIAVEKRGTYSVPLNELKNRMLSEEKKILDFEQLKKIAEDCRRKDKKIVWTNGCFDILHTGHVKYLKEAKSFGDVLILGLDSDESVRKLKGPGRPINSELERAEILSSMEFIDYIIIFPEGAVKNYLAELKPDVYVKGGDYNVDTINQEERNVVEGYGGKIALVKHVPGKSTTKTIEKIKLH